MLRALSTMGVLAGLPVPLIPKDGSGVTRVPVKLSWVSGMAVPFLQLLEVWWYPHSTSLSAGSPYQASAAAAARHTFIPEVLTRFLRLSAPIEAG